MREKDENQQKGVGIGYYENGSVFTSFSNKILQKKWKFWMTV